jgi:hypothetical protein
MSPRAHVVVAVITISLLVFIVQMVRRRHLRAKYSLLWLTVGLIVTVLAVSPAVLDRVSLLLGIAYGPTTLFMAAITLLLVLVAHFSWELSRLEERTRTLAEELALIRIGSPEKESGPAGN